MAINKFKLAPKKEQRITQEAGKIIVKGKPLRPRASIEDKYRANLLALVKRMTKETKDSLTSLLKDQALPTFSIATDGNVGSQARILMNKLSAKFQAMFDRNAGSMAIDMISATDAESAIMLRKSLKDMSGGLAVKADFLTGSMKESMAASVAENVGLIKSIPQQYMTQVQGAVMRSILPGGNGLQDLVPFLTNQAGVTERRAENIALDQTRKAYNNINAQRMQAVGVDKFEWIHSGGGQKPRPLHVSYDGRIFSFDDLPIIDEATGERGIPGQAINCFIGSTEVSLADGCLNLWRYFYVGEVVSLHLQGDLVITCTPNHPILTGRGWLAANEIQEGDKLLGGKANSDRIVNNERADLVTTFDDLFLALSTRQNAERRLASEFNFHGDIPENEVDCISVDQDLLLWLESLTQQEREKLLLPGSNCSSLPLVLSVYSEVLHSRGSSSFRESDPLVSCHSGHPQDVSLASTPKDNPVFPKDSSNNISSHTKSLGDGENTLASDGVLINNVGRHSINSVKFNDGRDAVVESLDQVSGKSMGASPILLGETLKSRPFIEFGHCVEKKLVSIFSGHVYTMQSKTGTYNITSAMIKSKNCRCVMAGIVEYTDGEEDDQS
jgi:SPP1 gp7 family putative phage head morphogenesis protein